MVAKESFEVEFMKGVAWLIDVLCIILSFKPIYILI